MHDNNGGVLKVETIKSSRYREVVTVQASDSKMRMRQILRRSLGEERGDVVLEIMVPRLSRYT